MWGFHCVVTPAFFVWFPQMCSRALRASIDTNRLYTVNVSLWVISVSLHWPQCIVEQLLSIQRHIDSSVFPFAVRKWHSKCWSFMVWSMIIILLLRIVTKKKCLQFLLNVRCFDLHKLLNLATLAERWAFLILVEGTWSRAI